MLAKQLKQVIEIDERINTIHRELSDLYSERARITEEDDQTPPKTEKISHTMSKDRWVSMQYQRLLALWQNYDIAVPSKKTLQPKLQKAFDVTNELAAKAPDIANNLTVLLVPPYKQLAFPVAANLREKQGITSDFVNPEYTSQKKTKAWRVLVVYAAKQGLYLGNADMIVENRSYLFGDYDMRALGHREYAALTLQEKNIDNQSWTLLMSNYQENDGAIAIAGSVDNRYRFDLTEGNSIFSDDRFRPAVEV